ncbi:MAG TPA: GNAT family N-acetyltransferase [Acidimicrobiia bacterium]|nr:GNAT family N-acetyltransferase [Acidimicrobiia bacterium]
MEIVPFEDADSFLQTAMPFLLREEAANNLILGVVAGAARGDYDKLIGWTVIDGDEIVTAAARTPPQGLILARTQSLEGVDALATATPEVPGIIGALPEVDWFARHRSTLVRKFRQGIYKLSEVHVPIEPGSRRATSDERDLLLTWMIAFMEEVSGEEADPEAANRNLERRLEEADDVAGVWIHETDSAIVCMSAYSGPTPNGIRIGPVYTPVEHRARGYASRLVAAQSQWLIDNGNQFCFLYTDLDNSTSNAIYQRIGYRIVCESAEYSFSRSL